MTVCIDTNVVLGMFGRKGPWRPIRQALIEGRLVWAVTTEILLEYEEVALREMGSAAAGQLIRFIDLLAQTRSNVRQLSPTFRFQVITADPDDNKFTDCAITAGADYMVTEDRHFAPLATAGYHPQPITPAEFIAKHL
ncbi:MAG: putative toxin-antitoxin system toxin component, PIN family [Verrucomicrobiales bacterium VVV1]|nr:MAG: putative toxin-antitoxin system toxin component, PIN family [Verrucomicrobiales bacterium VVV1]